MSELMLLVACRRWRSEGCGRLVRECRLQCLFWTSSCYGPGESWSKLSYRVPVATRTISRQLTCWDSLPGFLLRPREHVWTSVALSAKVRGPWRAASIVPERDTSAIPEDDRNEFTSDFKEKTVRAAQLSLCLQQLLGFNAEEAELWVKDHQGFALTDSSDIPQNYKACRDAGFSETAVRQNPWVLSYPCRILKVKIELIASMNIPVIDDAIPFFKLGITTLRLFSNKLKYEAIENDGANKITYLTEQLQSPMLTVCQVVAKHHFMRTVTFSKLSQVLKIMLESHITKDDILNDVWAFRYSPDIITERLKRVTDAGVHPVKPWMIRCPEVALARRIGKELCRRSILGDKGTIVEYLSQRFKCDQRPIAALIGKHPKIAQVSGPKIKHVVDFLLENGYTVEHVMRVPRVLFHRLETMQERLTELRKYKHKPKSLLVLCKSRQQYNAYLNMVKLKWLMTDSK